VIVFLLVRSALRGLQTSPVTTAIATATIAIALVLVGAFGLLVGNMQGLLEGFGRDLKVTAYLAADLAPDRQRALATEAATLDGVEQVDLVDEAEALARFERMQGGAALLEGLEGNPLPASLEIVLDAERRTETGLRALEAELVALAGIDEVAHGQEWIEGYARAAGVARGVGLLLGAVLVLATLLIVMNTIRLAVYARADELDILALVGASRTYVRVPFLLEGTLQGAVGGAFAVALLAIGFQLFVPQLRDGLVFFLGNAAPRFLDGGEIARMVIGGAGLGLLGSFAALLGERS
jgi:cell division transport system permease protein